MWSGSGKAVARTQGKPRSDLPVGSLPEGSGKQMRFTGTTVLRVENGLITEELGLDDGVIVLKQLGLIPNS